MAWSSSARAVDRPSAECRGAFLAGFQPPTTTRPVRMDEVLFRQTIDQVADQDGFLVYPQGFGEPLLHPKWSELLSYAHRRGVQPIVLLTNGILLDGENVRRILEVGLDALLVSIDGVRPETYRRLRVGGELPRVERNVLEFLERRGPSETPRLVLRIIRMRENHAEIAPFFERWSPLLGPLDQIHVNEFDDWAGKVQDRSVESVPAADERGPCRMLWKNLSVHADGKVSACCVDSEDELIVGELTGGRTLEEIWHGPEIERLRKIHRERRFDELPICRTCKAWF